jgi:hypothetical protein
VTITERVERGAALLDEKRPEWWQLIELERLDIGSHCDCIAGQLSGGYNYRFLADIGVENAEHEESAGFDTFRQCDRETEYAALTAAWRALIESRRAAASVPA